MQSVGSKSPATDTLESAIGGRIAVWVGAIALALGGVFLVKYSIDHGLLSPVGRVVGGLLLGFGLGGVAWRLRDRSNYVAQGLAAAAVICIYACLWAAVGLYDLIPGWLGMIGMVATTLAAVAAALRLGPLVAVIGLVGAFLAPLLVGNAEAHPIGLFAYLLALQLGGQYVGHKRKWVWASAISLGAGAMWVLTDLVLHNDQIWPGLFLLGSTLMFALPGIARRGRENIGLVWAAGITGTLLLALTLGVSGFAPLVWVFFGLLSAALGLLGMRDKRFEYMPWLAFAVTLVLTVLHSHGGGWAPTHNLLLALALGLLFLAIGFAGLWMARRVSFTVLTAVAPAAFVCIALLTSYSAVSPEGWMYIMLGIAALYTVLAAVAVRWRHLLDDNALAALVAPAMLFAAVAWPFGLTMHWCVMLWSAQVACAMGVHRLLNLPAARFMALLLLLPVLCAMLTPAVLLGDFGDAPLLNWGTACYVAAIGACLLGRSLDADQRARQLFSVATVALWLAFGSFTIRHTAHGGDLLALAVPPLEVSAYLIHALVTAGWLLAIAPSIHQKPITREANALRYVGLGIATLALTLGAALLLTAGNPWLMHEPVRGIPVLNTITLGIGVPILLMAGLASTLGRVGYSHHRVLAWWVTGGLIVFYVLLQVRHAFHGSIMWGAPVTSLENYAYSLALLLLALSTLGLGLVRESRTLRVVALCGMLVCSIKVFAFDMRQLEGLLRVLSFLGLGASLMGLGYIYNRFTPARRELVQ